MNEREIFDDVKKLARKALGPGEGFLLSYDAEDSTFVRMNHSLIRQPSHVLQREVTFELTKGKKHVSATFTISGTDKDDDRTRLRAVVEELRRHLADVPDDPYFLRAEPSVSTKVNASRLADAAAVVDEVQKSADGVDLVGIYAAGGIYRGHASDEGASRWFASYPFQVDYSIYLQADRATKGSYAGFQFDNDKLAAKINGSRADLDILSCQAKTIAPGGYRAYFAPAATAEIFGLLSGGAFSRREIETKQSPLLPLTTGERQLDPRVTLRENVDAGIGPNFQSAGFSRPDHITLIGEGRFENALTSPRSASEYKTTHNGADADESPTSLDLAPGTLAPADVLDALGTGVYVSNLWYTNYSDRMNCRFTGLTRFATFWVENGVIVSPLAVMRFDDSCYRLFGDALVDLTSEAELILDADTYFRRSTNCMRMPGALVSNFKLTL